MTKRLAGIALRRTAGQQRLPRRIRPRHHLLHGQRAAAPGARPGPDGGCAAIWARRYPARVRRCSCWPACRRSSSPCAATPWTTAGSLWAHIGAGRRRGRAHRRRASSTTRAARLANGLRVRRRPARLAARRQRALPASRARSERSHSQSRRRAGLHGRGRRRRPVAVLPLVGADQHRRHHPVELLHGLGGLRRSATRTSTSSGRARCTTSPRSTTSSTGSRSSTCRTWSGTRPSKWCAGCHDHAVFFNGRFDRPIKEQIDTPEAQAGLGCMSCHAIVHVGSTMGNGDFTIEYPPLHELATSKNTYIRAHRLLPDLSESEAAQGGRS